MQILKDVVSASHFIKTQKLANSTIGLVPTMGALHQGHLSLVARCSLENDCSIASIFVNPIQFNNADDLAKYPRKLERDVALLEGVGCKAVFCPSSDDIYKVAPMVSLDFGNLDKTLEGQFRPDHFSGVGLIVAKLLNIVQPDVAYFGLKDFQQFMIITRLVHDFSFPVKLVGCEIVREHDGLAMSSRNERLIDEQRKRASLLYQILQQCKTKLGSTGLEQIKTESEALLAQSKIRLEYLELAHRETLKICTSYDPDTPSVLLIAAYVDDVRLIDNLFI